jgi:2-keto-myo-inositol isomerase
MKADTIKFIESAGKNGFSQIELDIDRLEAAIKKDGLAKIRATLENTGVQVLSLNAIDNYPIMTEDEMAASLRRAGEVIELCNKVDCKILVVNPANFTSKEQEKLVEKRFDHFIDRVSELSEERGVIVGYEYVSYNDKVVNTLEKTLEGLARWNSGISLVLDVFHMYRSEETFKDLPFELTRKLLAFHVNDAPGIKIENLVDTDRVFPPDGVIGVEKYVEELCARNYAGPVSMELFNKEYWEKDVDYVVMKSKESLDRFLDA